MIRTGGCYRFHHGRVYLLIVVLWSEACHLFRIIVIEFSKYTTKVSPMYATLQNYRFSPGLYWSLRLEKEDIY